MKNFANSICTTLSEEIHEKIDANKQPDKNGGMLDHHQDDDLLKAESQEMLEHKAYQAIHQEQYQNAQPGAPPPGHHALNYHQMPPGKPDVLPGPLPYPVQLGRPLPPGHVIIPNLPPQKPAHHIGPSFNQPLYQQQGPQPVYPGQNGLPQHENQVDYGEEPNQAHQYNNGQEQNPNAGYPNQGYEHNNGHPQGSNNELWPLPAPEMPKIAHLDVKCEKNLMKVAIEFDKPFNGIIFSKGHYNYGNCVHLPAGTGKTSVYFDISITSCGTTGNTQNGLYGYGAQSGSGSFFENTIVIQYDPQVQEVWDQARKLRCTWHDQYEKSVTFRPFPVDMLDVVRADFAGDNVGCWMQIQVGKGPWASEVAGIVKIGQTMTMVLAIKDEENKFDMLVRNCIAHDGKRAPIELVDSIGCIVRPKLMSRFTKIKNFGSSATVLSYAHFQAFKFPDSMEVHFQCTIQICRYKCPEQCSQGSGQVDNVQHMDKHLDNYAVSTNYHSIGKPREERDLSKHVQNLMNSAYSIDSKEIGLNRILKVVSSGDLAFSLQANETLPVFDSQEKIENDIICMSTINFTASIVILISILIISCLVSVFLCLRQRSTEKQQYESSSKQAQLSEIRTFSRKPNLILPITAKC
ncbi:uncharacterized protein B4U79_11581 [Dinothrombium tinctorium]|uniref:ZP domain-containing protein n=1 Tax=Dinothrombium tinctorium TaxID=1965070 RepID=A0A443RBC8_9ACAR|nr:uncharacterized protein B4U79_11581 [Dinothrombium tinctorium]